MEATLVDRAVAATMSLACEAGVRAEHAEIVQNSNKLTVRILPCDLLARVAVAGQHVGTLEIAVAEGLTARRAPVARLDVRLERRVHERDGFAVTFWTYYEDASPPRSSPAAYADALYRLHVGMRDLGVVSPHFTDRIAEAEQLVLDRQASPALPQSDRDLLAYTLRDAHRTIASRSGAEQLLHGEPHPGNVLSTRNGPIFIDFETCCRGPVEFDVAHVPDDIARHYPDLDLVLLSECRRLILAMVAAWRWDVHDEFPNGRRHGEAIVTLLRAGPPWPPLDALSAQ